MDISVFNTLDTSNEGSWMDIVDFDGDPIGAKICVFGPDSETSAQLSEDDARFLTKRLAEASAKGKRQEKESDEGIIDRNIRKAVKLTKTWEGLTWGKEEFPFNKDNAVKLYTKCPSIRQQVINFNASLERFTPPEYAKWKKRFGRSSSSTSPEKTE